MIASGMPMQVQYTMRMLGDIGGFEGAGRKGGGFLQGLNATLATNYLCSFCIHLVFYRSV